MLFQATTVEHPNDQNCETTGDQGAGEDDPEEVLYWPSHQSWGEQWEDRSKEPNETIGETSNWGPNINWIEGLGPNLIDWFPTKGVSCRIDNVGNWEGPPYGTPNTST